MLEGLLKIGLTVFEISYNNSQGGGACCSPHSNFYVGVSKMGTK